MTRKAAYLGFLYGISVIGLSRRPTLRVTLDREPIVVDLYIIKRSFFCVRTNSLLEKAVSKTPF